MRIRLTCSLVLLLAAASGCGAPTPDELLADARAAFASGELSTADIHLRNLLQEDPENPAARLLLGQVRVGLGDMAAAEVQLQRAVELGADPASAHMPLIRALAGQGKYDAVLAEIANGPAVEGDDLVDRLRIAAIAHLALGDPEAAEASYREALAADPSSASVRTELGELLLATGRAADGQSLVADVLTTDPDFAPALLVRGQVERQAGARDQAEETYRSVIAREQPGSQARVVAVAQLAELLLQGGEVEEAAGFADELMQTIPNSPVTQYIQARVEFARGQVDEAESRLETIIASFPTYAPANQFLGAINADQGQFGQAEMYLQSAVAQAPAGDQTARILLGQVYLRQEKFDQARVVLTEAFPAAASDAVLFAIAGQSSRARGETDKALEYFDRSESSPVDNAEQLYNLANIYASSGELDRAVRVVESYEPTTPDARTMRSYLLTMAYVALNNAAQASAEAAGLADSLPDQVWPLALQGAIALRSGDGDAARSYYSRALDKNPSVPEQTALLFNLAQAEALRQDVEAVEAALERVIGLDPTNARANLMLAELALRERDTSAAATYLANAPESAARLQLEGQLAFAEGRDSDALELFITNYEQNPSAQSAVLAYSAARRVGEPNPESWLEDWLEEDPENAEVNFIYGTHILENGGQLEAIDRFETVIAAQPEHAAALNNLAWLYGEANDPRAIATARRAYDAAPTNGAIADTLGWLLLGEGNAAEAMPVLEQAVAAFPDNPEIRYHRAVALAATGDSATAIAELEAVLGDNTAFPWRADAEARLRQLREP